MMLCFAYYRYHYSILLAAKIMVVNNIDTASNTTALVYGDRYHYQ